MVIKKEDRLNQWSLKNERRTKAKQANPRLYSEGRWNRKSLSTKGAFGQENARIYNMCAIGTTAGKKLEKKSKGEYDSGSDYDQ